jgi:hypothetical protein
MNQGLFGKMQVDRSGLTCEVAADKSTEILPLADKEESFRIDSRGATLWRLVSWTTLSCRMNE